MALYALIIVALYPQFKNSVSLNQLTKNGNAVAALFGATGSLTSPAGWLDANIYANFLPLIMLLITIGYGASCIAGQDEDGTLSLAAALPIPRRTILLQKALTLAVQAVLLGLATMICVLIGRGFDLSHPRSAASPGSPLGVIAPRNRLRPARPGTRLLDRPPRHRARHHRVHRRSLLPGQLARPRGRMDPARQVRLPLLLVRRQRPAHHRAHRAPPLPSSPAPASRCCSPPQPRSLTWTCIDRAPSRAASRNVPGPKSAAARQPARSRHAKAAGRPRSGTALGSCRH